MTTDLAEILAFADELADAARAAILPHFRTGGVVDNKQVGGFDPVTEADRAAEAAMRALIEARYPSHGVIGEEYGDKPGDGRTWVLDPIDGTRAFIAGLPTWGVLIGFVEEGQAVAGVMDQPFTGERWSGGRGQGALWRRGAERSVLKTRPCEHLADAVIATTDPVILDPRWRTGFDAVRSHVRLCRLGLDCYAYAVLSGGWLDMVLETGLKDVDIAALIPIIEAAGGVVTDWRGDPPALGGDIIAAGDARALDAALAVIAESAA
jgi:histidinol phosphatase-like enzyme (inositol monophosphatase family)